MGRKLKVTGQIPTKRLYFLSGSCMVIFLTHNYTYGVKMNSFARNERMKILVAEDEVNIAESYKLILEFKGHEVTLTMDGEKCLEVYKESLVRGSSSSGSAIFSGFGLVILDYRMPKKDGVQVAQEILSIVPSQRILLATAYVHDLSVARLQEVPATKTVELIQKPFDFDAFLQVVHAHSTIPALVPDNIGNSRPTKQEDDVFQR